MIKSLRLRNFKCFADQAIPFGMLTLLAGMNGTGKSSVIQSLLILRQSFSSGDLSAGRLLLGGDLVDLGTGRDVLYVDASENQMSITICETNDLVTSFSFLYDREADLLMSDSMEGSEVGADQSLSQRWPFCKSMYYVHAERLGPRKNLPMSEARVRAGDLGLHGEYVLHALSTNGERLLAETDPRLNVDYPRSIASQVGAWLREVSPGCQLDIALVRAADLAIAGYKFDREQDISTTSFRATNVGFGISYVLPLIYALVASDSGALVIIENPEAHLHPRGQTRLGQLAARAAAAGVQIVSETHSDHFMDGVRMTVRDGIAKPKDCIFNYFSRSGALSSLETPTIDRDGRLSSWPDGFFDQRDENLAALVAPRRHST